DLRRPRRLPRRGRGRAQGAAGRTGRGRVRLRRGGLHRHRGGTGRRAAGVAAGGDPGVPAAAGLGAVRPEADQQATDDRTATAWGLQKRLRGGHVARAARPATPGEPLRGGAVKFLTITLIAHNDEKSPTERFREVVENAVLAEELGFDGFGVGERHERPFLSSSPPVVLSHIAAKTSRIRLFTAVTTLSLLDPVRAYEDYATL